MRTFLPIYQSTSLPTLISAAAACAVNPSPRAKTAAGAESRAPARG